MNPVVYTCTGRKGTWAPQTGHLQAPARNWMAEKRVSEERHSEALSALRKHYMSKASALGMSLSGYCQRFNIKL